jgi:hypothetical protein
MPNEVEVTNLNPLSSFLHTGKKEEEEEGLPYSNGELETTTIPQLPIMIFHLPHKHGLSRVKRF